MASWPTTDTVLLIGTFALCTVIVIEPDTIGGTVGVEVGVGVGVGVDVGVGVGEVADDDPPADGATFGCVFAFGPTE